MKDKGGLVKSLMWIVLFPVMLILAISRKEGWSGKRKAAIIVTIIIATLGISIGGADDAVEASSEPPALAVEEMQKTEEEPPKLEETQECATPEKGDSQETGEASVEKKTGDAIQNAAEIELVEAKDFVEQGSENTPVLQVHFLDVGQALSVLVMDMQGNELLYDAGNEGDAEFIISYLQDLEIDRLEYVVNSHPHEDHIGGMDRILERFEVDQVFMAEKAYDSQAYRDVMNILDEKQMNAVHPEPGEAYALGELVIQVLGPLGSEYENTNDYSVILKIGNAIQSVLLVGDSEAAAEHELVEAGVNLHADVFQVSHHGSSTSNTIQYLSKIDPDYAVISVGADNRYGHPDATILERLRNMGISTYETDLDGTVVMTLDGSQIFVEVLEEARSGDGSSDDQLDSEEKNIADEPQPEVMQEKVEESVVDEYIEESSDSSSEISEEEIDARDEEKGSQIVIVELDKRAEYVLIQNTSSEVVDLGGWRIESIDGGQVFKFPMQALLEAGEFFKITSGSISAEGDFMMAKGHVWDNKSKDSARLIDSNGTEVDFFEDMNY